MKQPGKRFRLIRLLSAVVSLVLLAVLFSHVSNDDSTQGILSRFMSPTFAFWMAVVAAYSLLINLGLGAFKWSLIKKASGLVGIPFLETLRVRTACVSFSLLFPLNTWNAFACLYFKKARDLDMSKVGSTIIFDKYLNLIASFFIILVAGLVYMAIHGAGTLAVVAVLGFGLLLVVVVYFDILAGKLQLKSEVLSNLVMSFNMPTKTKLVLLGLSVVYQFSEIVSAAIIFRALQVDLALEKLAFIYPLIMLAAYIPVTLSGLGLRETLIVLLFGGASAAEILATGGFMISLLEFLLPSFCGIIVFAMMNKKFLAVESDALESVD